MSIAERIDLLQPPVTATRIAPAGVAPSFKRLAGDEWELTTSVADSAAALEELARLDPEFDWSGYTAELVEAKADPAAWHRDVAYDENGRKTPAVTRPVVRKRYIIRRAVPETERADLVKYVLTRKPAKPLTAANGGAFVVCLADLQIGKTGPDGGTQDLLGYLLDALAIVTATARKIKPARIVIADLGDGCENVENVAAQAFSNDLSFTDQLDLFNAVTTKACTDLAAIAPVTFVSVPSNHMQLRKQRERIGTSHDDFGILNAKTLSRTFTTAGRDDITVVIPERHAESLTVDIDGLNVGFAHGHQVNNPDKIPEWWSRQAFGGMPLEPARLLLTGHFHSLRLQTAGDGKTWMQAPTMDPGSEWYANLTGEQSHRGLLTFRVVDGAWRDLQVV